MSFHHTNWLTMYSKVTNPLTLLIMKTMADGAADDTGLVSANYELLAKFCRNLLHVTLEGDQTHATE